ncbi:LOW QUALITY PROTEIN: hypothetical protein RJ639_012914, partial [Escallonia herrerae]
NCDTIKEDKLVLSGLKFHGYHGVKVEERKLGQKFLIGMPGWISEQLVNLTTYQILSAIPKSTEKLWRDLLRIFWSQWLNSLLLQPWLSASRFLLFVGKPHVAVQGPVDYLGVKVIIFRSINAKS